MKLKQAELADRLRVTQSTVSRWESGADDAGYETVQALLKLAKTAKFDPSPYINDSGQFSRDETPIVGKTDSRGQIVGSEVTSMESPPGLSRSAEAFRVVGTALAPAYRDGAILFYDGFDDPEDMIGKECVVRLSDGRRFLKILSRGSGPGLFNLLSPSGEPPILDVVVESASPIVWIKPAI